MCEINWQKIGCCSESIKTENNEEESFNTRPFLEKYYILASRKEIGQNHLYELCLRMYIELIYCDCYKNLSEIKYQPERGKFMETLNRVSKISDLSDFENINFDLRLFIAFIQSLMQILNNSTDFKEIYSFLSFHMKYVGILCRFLVSENLKENFSDQESEIRKEEWINWIHDLTEDAEGLIITYIGRSFNCSIKEFTFFKEIKYHEYNNHGPGLTINFFRRGNKYTELCEIQHIENLGFILK